MLETLAPMAGWPLYGILLIYGLAKLFREIRMLLKELRQWREATAKNQKPARKIRQKPR
jgi:hypothetical protein